MMRNLVWHGRSGGLNRPQLWIIVQISLGFKQLAHGLHGILHRVPCGLQVRSSSE